MGARWMTESEILNSLTEMDKKAVLSYAENSMRMSRAAKALFMVHSAVYYHIISIKAKTGLDPRNFYDLSKLINLIQKGETPSE